MRQTIRYIFSAQKPPNVVFILTTVKLLTHSLFDVAQVWIFSQATSKFHTRDILVCFWSFSSCDFRSNFFQLFFLECQHSLCCQVYDHETVFEVLEFGLLPISAGLRLAHVQGQRTPPFHLLCTCYFLGWVTQIVACPENYTSRKKQVSTLFFWHWSSFMIKIYSHSLLLWKCNNTNTF